MRTPDTPVLMLAVAQTLLWAALAYSFPALVLEFEAGFGWPRERVMLVLSGGMVAAALGMPLSGWLVDRGRGPAALTGGAAAGGLLLLALSFAGSGPVFAAIWVLVGLAGSFALYEPTFSYLTRARGPGARRAITTVTLVAGLAGTLAFPLCHWLADIGGWRLALRVLAAMVLLAAVPLVWLATARIGPGVDAGAGADGTGASTVPLPGRGRAIWLLGLAVALIAVANSAVAAHILPLLQDRGAGPGAAVLAAALIGPMQIAGRAALLAAGPDVADRRVAAAALISQIAALAALALAGGGVAMLAGFVVLQGAGIGVMTIMRPMIARAALGPRGFGQAYGFLGTFGLCGLAAAPALGALVWRAGGYGLMLAGAALCLACALVLVLAVTRRA